MRKRMAAVSSVPLIVCNEATDEVLDGHPLQLLMESPTPELDGTTLLEIIVGSLDSGGNAYLHIVRNAQGVPLELWPIPQDGMKPVHQKGDKRYISHYRYDWQGAVRTIPAEDVLHLAYTHPEDRFSGMSPLRAAGMAVDLDNEASAWQKVSLQNRGVPDGIFSLEGEDIGPEEWEEARRQVREQYTGTANAREPWVVANAKWQQMSLTPAELDFAEARTMTRTEICAAYEVPPPMVGIYDDATLANIETARKIFWRDTILPLLEQLAGQITRALAPGFGGGIYLKFDISNIAALRESYTDKLTQARVLWSMGVPLTVINDRLELGLNVDEIEGADVGYVPAGLIPTDMPLLDQLTETPEERQHDSVDLIKLHEIAYGPHRRE